jgi:hypothetical protein
MNEDSSERSKHGKEIRFSLNDKFSERKIILRPICQAIYKCCRWKFDPNVYMSKSMRLYQKGYHKVVKELDIIHILKTLHKIKAGCSAVLENDKDLIKLSRDMYLNHTTLFSDTEDEKMLFLHNKFTDFLNVDHREEIIDQGIKSDIRHKLKSIFSNQNAI